MKLPGRSQLPPDPHGRQVTADSTRHGFVDDGCLAWPERLLEARRCWPEANPADFEKLARRRYRDKATGTEYVALQGAVMLDVAGESHRGVSCFMVENGRIVCLRLPQFEEPLCGPEGRIYSQRLTPENPGPALRVY